MRSVQGIGAVGSRTMGGGSSECGEAYLSGTRICGVLYRNDV